jgi:antitoxin Phd
MTSRKGEEYMKSWPVQDAKARFSEFLKASLTEGPQVVTLRGVEAAVLVPMQEWRSLRERARPSLKALLFATEARGELKIPPRGNLRRRAPRTIG